MLNFFAIENRLERLEELGDTLVRLNQVVDWQIFDPVLESIFKSEPKGQGGRPPYNRVMMFKIMILQQLYNIADDQTEYQINDRLSFQRFLGMDIGDKVPDAKTIWLYREQLKESQRIEELFDLYTWTLEKAGYITRRGSIVDATFVERPRQPEGKTGGNTEEKKTNRERQTDRDAKGAKKGGKSYYGFKNHVKVDADSKLIVRCTVTAANRHDGKEAANILDEKDREAYMDACYRGREIEKAMQKAAPNAELHIVRKHDGWNEASEEQQAANPRIERVRNRVEHVFGYMVKSMGGKGVRCVGLARARVAVTLKNLAYNMRRASYLMG